MILVDTSAWIEYLRGTGSVVNLRVRELIASVATVATTDPVNMEVLAGARSNSDEGRLRRFLRGFVIASVDPAVDFEAASRIYRLCRAAGVTPRSLIDCMIVSVATRHGAAVLAHDTDFARMAGVVTLELDPATRTSE